MGVDFYLACADCKDFIELHKWQVIEEAGHYLIHSHYEPGQFMGQRLRDDSLYRLKDLDTLCKKILVTVDQIEESLHGEVPDHPYIRELTPIVWLFVSEHRGHELFLSCDLGDPSDDPWYPGRPGFAEWRELPGVFLFHRYLPRNVVEVDGFRSWTEAFDQLREEWPFAYCDTYAAEIATIKSAFEQLLTKYES